MNLPVENKEVLTKSQWSNILLWSAGKEKNRTDSKSGAWLKKRVWIIMLLPLSCIVSQIALKNPAATEAVYSTGIYRVISGFFGFLVSLLPKSVTETAIVVLPFLVLIYTVHSIVSIIRCKGIRLQQTIRFLSASMCIVSCTVFAFTAFCGLNYSRETFADSTGLLVEKSSLKELKEMCGGLIVHANELRGRLPENDAGVMISGFSRLDDTALKAQQIYRDFAQDYPTLSGYIPRPKPVRLSRAMSHLNITGVYIPFMFEANINADISEYLIPAVMMHEISHFKGYMREEEANFIAYLSCRSSGDIEFEYSGTMMALQNSLNALYKADPESHTALSAQISAGVQRDRAANREYWKQFEGNAAKLSSKVNDAYLKTNHQTSGIQSYGQMVDLLLAEFRQGNFCNQTDK